LVVGLGFFCNSGEGYRNPHKYGFQKFIHTDLYLAYVLAQL